MGGINYRDKLRTRGHKNFGWDVTSKFKPKKKKFVVFINQTTLNRWFLKFTNRRRWLSSFRAKKRVIRFRRLRFFQLIRLNPLKKQFWSISSVILVSYKVLLRNFVYLGSRRWNSFLFYYILGNRNNNFVLNLRFSIFMLRRAMAIIIKTRRLNSSIFMSSADDFQVVRIFKGLQQPYLTFWVGGVLTNLKFLEKFYWNNKKIRVSYKGLQFLNGVPHILCVLRKNLYMIHESWCLGIAGIGLVDSEDSIHNYTYPIIANDDTKFSLYLLGGIFYKSSLQGYKTYIMLVFNKWKYWQSRPFIKQRFIYEFIRRSKFFKLKKGLLVYLYGLKSANQGIVAITESSFIRKWRKRYYKKYTLSDA